MKILRKHLKKIVFKIINYKNLLEIEKVIKWQIFSSYVRYLLTVKDLKGLNRILKYI